jgi:hypothetical protein
MDGWIEFGARLPAAASMDGMESIGDGVAAGRRGYQIED